MRRLAPAAVGLMTFVVACGGSDRAGQGGRRPTPVPDPVMEEVAVQCLDLLDEYRETDFSTASESELQRQMDEALLNEALCEEALASAYDGPGGAMMGSHLAREMSLHALKAELTLSERFDEMSGYCAILEELVRALASDLNALAEEIAGGVSGERDVASGDLQALISLRDLSLQTLQVTLVDYQSTCGD